MKQTLSILTTLLLSSGAMAQTNTAPRRPVSVEIDGYAAQVNDRIITRGDVRESLTPRLPEIYRAYQGPQLEAELEKAFAGARRELVERALILEAFIARGGMIPDQYVNDEIKRMVKNRFKGDKALFEKGLTDQKKTRDEYVEEIREQIAVSMMVGQEISQRARITPEQVREEYEKNRDTYSIPEKVKYSVILLNKGSTEEDLAVKREEAETLRTRLMNGADFSELAKEVSEGSRAADGGAFPWMQPKDVRPELQNILKTLPAGEISEIIETEKELYLVKVDARRLASVKAFDDVRQDIKKVLTARERTRLRNRWIQRLKDTNYVVIYE